MRVTKDAPVIHIMPRNQRRREARRRGYIWRELTPTEMLMIDRMTDDQIGLHRKPRTFNETRTAANTGTYIETPRIVEVSNAAQ